MNNEHLNKVIKNTNQSEGINIIDTTNNTGYLDLVEDYKMALMLLQECLKEAETISSFKIRLYNQIKNFLK